MVGTEKFYRAFYKIDLRVGGKYLYDMREPDGKDYWNTGTFKEIKAPERLVLTDSFAPTRKVMLFPLPITE